MLGRTERRVILAVLWVEIASNVGNGLACILSPELALQPLTAFKLDAIAQEPVRWFGALNLVVGYLIFRMLRQPGGLRYLLEALCFGDIVYGASLVPFAQKYATPMGLVAPYGLTVIMFIARLRLLMAEDWQGAQRRAAAAEAGGGAYSVLDG